MLQTLRKRLLAVAEHLSFAGPLLARLSVGLVFISTGWGKLHHLSDLVDYFRELGIPAASLQAPMVASVEFFGGILILVGLLTRLAALPLAVTMVVAIITAKRGDIEGVTGLLRLEEWLFLVVFVWLAVAGAGKASLDHLIARLRRSS